MTSSLDVFRLFLDDMWPSMDVSTKKAIRSTCSKTRDMSDPLITELRHPPLIDGCNSTSDQQAALRRHDEVPFSYGFFGRLEKQTVLQLTGPCRPVERCILRCSVTPMHDRLTHLSLNIDAFTRDVALSLAAAFPKLDSLTIRAHVSIFGRVFDPIVVGGLTLRSLVVHDAYLSPDAVSSIGSLTSLVDLSLTRIRDVAWSSEETTICQSLIALSSLTRLSRLTLELLDGAVVDSVEHVFALTQLEHLTLGCVPGSCFRPDLDGLLVDLKDMKRLKSLHLIDLDLDDLAILALQHLTRLSSLRFGRASSVTLITPHVAFPLLEQLVVGICPQATSFNAVRSILRALGSLPRLTDLKIDGHSTSTRSMPSAGRGGLCFDMCADDVAVDDLT